jgi:hypothetical protein
VKEPKVPLNFVSGAEGRTIHIDDKKVVKLGACISVIAIVKVIDVD